MNKIFRFFIIDPKGLMRETAVTVGEDSFQKIYKMDLQGYFDQYKLGASQTYPGSTAGYIVEDPKEDFEPETNREWEELNQYGF